MGPACPMTSNRRTRLVRLPVHVPSDVPAHGRLRPSRASQARSQGSPLAVAFAVARSMPTGVPRLNGRNPHSRRRLRPWFACLTHQRLYAGVTSEHGNEGIPCSVCFPAL